MEPLKLLALAASFLTLCACSDSDTNPDTNPEPTWVYMYTQQTQCNEDGLSLDEVSGYLTDLSITPSQSLCGSVTGVEFAAVCGGGTGYIYLFEISSDELLDAENAGFLSTQSLQENQMGYVIESCAG